MAFWRRHRRAVPREPGVLSAVTLTKLHVSSRRSKASRATTRRSVSPILACGSVRALGVHLLFNLPRNAVHQLVEQSNALMPMQGQTDDGRRFSYARDRARFPTARNLITSIDVQQGRVVVLNSTSGPLVCRHRAAALSPAGIPVHGEPAAGYCPVMLCLTGHD